MKQRKRGQPKKSPPKHSLNLPDLDQSRSAVLNSLPSKESQRGYRRAIDEFIEWYCSEPRLSFNKAVVTRYRIHLESRTGGLSLDHLRLASDEEAERFLLCLPGLSWKSARCVMLYSLGKFTFPVDGNTFRIVKRLGIVPHNAVYRRKSLHDALQDAVPAVRRRPFHVNLVVHGQRICLPAKPRCGECAVRQVCNTYRSRSGAAST